MFQHFLITRFNLRKSDWKTNKNNVSVLTDEWHKNRFKLFTDFCFPSVVSQTNTNFKWLVFFDTTTPETYKKIVTELVNKLPNFTPIYVDGMDAFLPEIKKQVATNTSRYIITSRLDNDDCIGKNYVAEIQQRFQKQTYEAIDFVDGYTLQIAPDVRIGKKIHLFNPFISLIEKNENTKTVWSSSHTAWKKEKKIQQIRNVRIWSSIIHQENKVNEFTGFGNVQLDSFFDDFILPKTVKNKITNAIIPVSKWKMMHFKNATREHWNLQFKTLKKALGLYNS